MKLTRLTASFGQLDKAVLELKDGLNILQAPNEGGKSTWAAFLRVMLYGLDTRARDRKGVIADKNRFRPWSGAPMEGVLECRTGGRPMVLRRFTRGQTLMGAFSAQWADTGLPVEGMTGDNAGELLTGVGRDAFERSAFLRQSGLAVDQAPELERRIAALVSSGEEDVSWSQTDARLREWLRRRKYNSSGRIPRAEEELAQVEATLVRMEQATGRIAAAQAQREELLRRRAELEREQDLQARLAQQALDRQYGQAKAALDRAEEEERKLRAELARFGPIPGRERLRQAQEELAGLKAAEERLRQAEAACQSARAEAREADQAGQDPLFPGLTAQEALEQAEQVRGQAEAAQRGSESRRTRGLALMLASGLGALAAGALIFLLTRQAIPAAGAALLLFLALAVLSLVTSRKAAALSRQAQALLARYEAQRPEDITRRAADYQRLRQQAELALREPGRAEEELARCRADRDARQEALFRFVHAFAPEVTNLMGVSAALSRALSLEDKQAEAVRRCQAAREQAEFLRRQGGRESAALDDLAPPVRSRAETAAQLAAAVQELSRVEQELAMAQGEQRTLGDPAALQARRDRLQEELEQLRQDYQALETAIDALRAANEQLQDRFSPALNRRAGELLSALTGGRYDRVTLDRAFQATAEEAGELVPRPVPALSQGTADQLYLAVRLAICQLVLPGEDPCPLVLDDALTNFDDDRMTLALDLLRKLGEERQILLFTCHGREAACCAGLPGVSVQTLAP